MNHGTVKLKVPTTLTIHPGIRERQFFPLTNNAHQMDSRKVKYLSAKEKKI